MATGACGINCDVCRLNLKGVCSTCGPGTGETAGRKLAAQQRIIGGPCPILACARMNRIDHCIRDCDAFPCETFTGAAYPFSEAYLAMHERRGDDSVNAYASDGSHLEVDSAYWDDVRRRDILELCNWTFFEPVDAGCLQFRFLDRKIRIDPGRETLLRMKEGKWVPWDDSLLTLSTVMYLRSVAAIHPLGQDIVGCNELKEGHFFTGPHEFRTTPLLTRFAGDIDGFLAAGQSLGGKVLEMADAAVQLFPFPRVPLYFLLWFGDEEFKPRIQVLFDRSIEQSLAADAIWALVNRVAMAYATA
jgi:hypothetical protein